MTEKATLTVQAWGNSLAVRIPSRVARAARLVVGQPVSIAVANGAVIVYQTGRVKLTLEQKLRHSTRPHTAAKQWPTTPLGRRCSSGAEGSLTGAGPA